MALAIIDCTVLQRNCWTYNVFLLTVPVIELSGEQKTHILGSQEFGRFFDKASRLMERALGEAIDITFDYSGAEAEDTEAWVCSWENMTTQYFEKPKNSPQTSNPTWLPVGVKLSSSGVLLWHDTKHPHWVFWQPWQVNWNFHSQPYLLVDVKLPL